eukprot:TRINITY_DN57864_c0_g1_i1.p1 TRINITY_DN57864_c0_g1~~TRINITY_DN57864_c0_g1_i1.p1  ORF type:complete len:250 (+),score=50.59 TRINITY_DN57864_c0_g1_i1:166-915(+)
MAMACGYSRDAFAPMAEVAMRKFVHMQDDDAVSLASTQFGDTHCMLEGGRRTVASTPCTSASASPLSVQVHPSNGGACLEDEWVELGMRLGRAISLEPDESDEEDEIFHRQRAETFEQVNREIEANAWFAVGACLALACEQARQGIEDEDDLAPPSRGSSTVSIGRCSSVDSFSGPCLTTIGGSPSSRYEDRSGYPSSSASSICSHLDDVNTCSDVDSSAGARVGGENNCPGRRQAFGGVFHCTSAASS